MPESLPRAGPRLPVLPLLVSAAFAGVYLGARFGLERAAPGSRAALVLALAPAPFFVLLVVSFAHMVRGMDELARRIQAEALAVAFPCALVIAFMAGLLDLAGFHGRGDWDLPRLWPLLLLPYWFGLALAHRRYR